MAILKCKMCGGQLLLSKSTEIVECEYCGSLQTLPNLDSEKKTNLFNRANTRRMKKEFDEAISIYENLVAEFPEEAEAYWGLCLCKYGIEYVDDKRTGNKVPTCHRTSKTSILNDEDFKLAVKFSSGYNASLYEKEANAIDAIQRKILEIAAKEKPYDIFISYKEKDALTGTRTVDSGDAQDLYTNLVEKGYRVFFSRVTLSSCAAGESYEPYIFAALNSAKVMIVVGSKPEYLEAEWVKNEWSRYLSLTQNEQDKKIIVCYKNMDAYDLPEELKRLQALDMQSVTFHENLMKHIETTVLPQNGSTSFTRINETDLRVENLLRRAELALQANQYSEAAAFCQRILDEQPENWKGYCFAFLAKARAAALSELSFDEDYRVDPDFVRASRFAPEEEKNAFEDISNKCRIVKTYNRALSFYKEKQYKKAISVFTEIEREYIEIAYLPKYNQYQKLVDECQKQVKKENDYQNAVDELTLRLSGDFLYNDQSVSSSIREKYNALSKEKHKNFTLRTPLGTITWFFLFIATCGYVTSTVFFVLEYISSGVLNINETSIFSSIIASLFTGLFLEAWLFEGIFELEISFIRIGMLVIIGTVLLAFLQLYVLFSIPVLATAGIIGLIINRSIKSKTNKFDRYLKKINVLKYDTIIPLHLKTIKSLLEQYSPRIGYHDTINIIRMRIEAKDVQGFEMYDYDKKKLLEQIASIKV